MDQPNPAEQLPGLEVASTPLVPTVANAPTRPRVKAVDRSQLTWQMLDVEGLIEQDHPARAIWDLVRGIRQRGKTVLLTTHLMEEAERLCDRVAIIDHGRIVDVGTPLELVRRHCPEHAVVVTTDDPGAAERFRAIPRIGAITRDGSQLTLRGRGDDLVTEVVRCLAENRMRVIDFRSEVPTLEDVFLRLTGHAIRD